jgi:hypothetical protein
VWEHAARAAVAGEAVYRVENQPAGLDSPPPAWSGQPAMLRLLARVKRAFDPEGTLRPGACSAERLERAAEYFEGGVDG